MTSLDSQGLCLVESGRMLGTELEDVESKLSLLPSLKGGPAADP